MTTRESTSQPLLESQDIEPDLPCLPACIPFIEQLVNGIRPESDAALSDHVRGCLPCYRAAIELARVGEIATALTQASPRDPGDLFFASFARRVADTWLDPSSSAIAATTARHRHARSGHVIALVGLGTALAAAAALLLMVGSRRTDADAISARGGSGSTSATVGSARLPGSSPATGNDDGTNSMPESESETEIPLDPMAEIETLDTGALVRLADAVSRELADDLAEADNPTAGLTATESLELLGTPALAILSEDLHGIRDP